jgi:putative transposase
MIDLLKLKVSEISEIFEADVMNIECDKDHIHMIFKTRQTIAIPKFINAIKTITSREIRSNFSNIEMRIWNDIFESPSYLLITTRQVTLDVLKNISRDK